MKSLSHSQDESEISKEVNGHSEMNVSFVNAMMHSFTVRKNLFTTDQEIFIDSQHPLILLNDTNTHAPFPSFHPTMQTERKERNSQILVGLDDSPKKSSSSPRKSILRMKSMSPSKRKIDISNNESRDRRVSITVSAGRSDTFAKEADNEPASGNKIAVEQQEEEEEVDIFQENTKASQKKEGSRLKMRIRQLLDSTAYNIFIAFITLYALFAQDLCVIIFNRYADLTFDTLSLAVLGIFIVEITVLLYVKNDYRWSFFFWLDIVSTFSIIFDVDFIILTILFGKLDDSIQADQTSVLSSFGAKTGRVLRVVRLVRLVKLYKQILRNREINSFKKKKQQVRPEMMDMDSSKPASSPKKEFSHEPTRRASKPDSSVIVLSPLETPYTSKAKLGVVKKRGSKLQEASTKSLDKSPSTTEISSLPRKKSVRLSKIFVAHPKEPEIEPIKESRVGKQLSELTTKRAIIIVLALLLIIPLFSSDFFFDPPASQPYQMELLRQIIDSGASENAKMVALNTFIDAQRDTIPQIIFLQVNTTVLYNTEYDWSVLRSDEGNLIIVDTQTKGELVSIVQQRQISQLEGYLSIGRTLFICLVLTFAAVMFNKDAQDLILQPLERIITKVNKIAKDPLIAKEQKLVRSHIKGFANEAVEVENAIIKIGGLLALGFGDAGSSIIGQNIAKSGDINPMLPGKKKAAIYGFCDIRSFTDATEVLQEEVMVFVNSIAEVVHSMVDKYTGAANKNIGDAFLLVWKFPEDVVAEMADGQLEVISTQFTQNMADCALISFMKIYARINRDPTLLKYRENLLLNARLPNYKVKMGFGLHVGWAIEGAIGSEFKIDASYLSPNVNMASRLEAATKQYGVPLLFSGDLYEMMSDNMQDCARVIDVVTVKGSIKPIELYTVDMDVEDISVAKDKTRLTKEERRLRHKEKKEFIKDFIEKENAATLLETDKELKHLLRNKDEEFNNLFSSGFDAYIAGDWSTAKKKFDACLNMRKEDGPTKNLETFIAQYDFIAPEDWDGYHVLTEK